MTKDVFVSISGMHEEIAETPAVERDEAEAIEVVTPGSYYFRNEKHYIVYDEAVEGSSEMIRNRIKITGTGCVEIVKSGLSDSHMIFEKNKKNSTYYRTPYGQMLQVTEDEIDVRIEYELDVNHEPMADCRIKMNIMSRSNGSFSVLG